MSPRIDTFLAMLERGQDSAVLRFSLGNEYLQIDEPLDAVTHLRQAVAIDKNYSAAWKLLAKALTAAGKADEAMCAYADGISIAEANGDRQAAKEMQVFLKRLKKQDESK